MSLRGKAAIVGIGETPHKRSWPGRSALGLCAEVAAEAIKDAVAQRTGKTVSVNTTTGEIEEH